VSLILEALRKLDREKESPHRGVLVLGTVTAPDRSPRRVALGAVALAGVLALVAAVVLVARLAVPPPPPDAVESAAPVLDPSKAEARSGDVSPQSAARPASQPAPMHPPASLREPTESTGGVEPAESAHRAPAKPTETRSPSPAPAPQGIAEPVAETDPQALVLEAIADRDGERVAVLSGRLVREGDVFGATRVLRIGSSEVEIETSGVRRVLRF